MLYAERFYPACNLLENTVEGTKGFTDDVSTEIWKKKKKSKEKRVC